MGYDCTCAMDVDRKAGTGLCEGCLLNFQYAEITSLKAQVERLEDKLAESYDHTKVWSDRAKMSESQLATAQATTDKLSRCIVALGDAGCNLSNIYWNDKENRYGHGDNYGQEPAFNHTDSAAAVWKEWRKAMDTLTDEGADVGYNVVFECRARLSTPEAAQAAREAE